MCLLYCAPFSPLPFLIAAGTAEWRCGWLNPSRPYLPFPRAMKTLTRIPFHPTAQRKGRLTPRHFPLCGSYYILPQCGLGHPSCLHWQGAPACPHQAPLPAHVRHPCLPTLRALPKPCHAFCFFHVGSGAHLQSLSPHRLPAVIEPGSKGPAFLCTEYWQQQQHGWSGEKGSEAGASDSGRARAVTVQSRE